MRFLIKAIIIIQMTAFLGCAAKARFEEGKIDHSRLSAAELESALVQSPQDPLIHFHLAEQYRKKGYIDEAITEYKSSVLFAPEMSFKVDPILADLYRSRAEARLRDKRWEEAEKDYRQALEYDPELKDRISVKLAGVHIKKAQEHIIRGEWEAAIREYKLAAGQEPMIAREISSLVAVAQFRLGQRYKAEKKYPQAVKALKEASASSGQIREKAAGMLASIYGQWGKELKDSKKYEDAIKKLEEAVSRDPGDLGSKYHLADIHWKRGEVEEAVKIWQEVIKEDSGKFYKARQTLGNLFLEKGDYPNARKMFEELASIFPYNASFHFILGGIYSQLNLSNEAYLAHRKALINNPGIRESMGWQGYTARFRAYYFLRHLLEDYTLELFLAFLAGLSFLYMKRESIVGRFIPLFRREVPLSCEQVIRLEPPPAITSVPPAAKPEVIRPVRRGLSEEDLRGDIIWDMWAKMPARVRARLILGRGRANYLSLPRRNPCRRYMAAAASSR